MCPAISMNVVGSDLWNAHGYSAMSVTFRVFNSLHTHGNVVKTSAFLVRLDRMIVKMLNDIYTGAATVPPGTPMPSPERIAGAISMMRNLHGAIERICASIDAAGLADHIMVSAPASSLRAHADDILDLAESLELMMNPDIDSIFDKALEEHRRGESFDLQDIYK